MDKEEALFQKIAQKLVKEKHVKKEKMMSAPGISYKNKFFAFYYKKEITLRLGKGFAPKSHGVKKWKYLNPFKKKAPMKNWYQIPFSESKNWQKLAKHALTELTKELNNSK